MTTAPTSVLATCRAVAVGGRAGGKVSINGTGLFIHTEHPKGLGGSGEGSNPEQLFAMGYASCFNGALMHVAGQRKLDVARARVTCEVDIGPAPGGGFALAVRLSAHMPGLDPATARELIEAAHQVCPYSNATRGNVPVELSIV
jgi:Ohr subfamily peroxiredoxin